MVHARRGQSAGYGVAYRWRGRLLRVGQRGQCVWASTGAAADAGVRSRPRSPTGALWSALARGIGNGEVGEVRGLQVGPRASPGRWLDAGWGLEVARVREREGE
jgi:hypothetical protein